MPRSRLWRWLVLAAALCAVVGVGGPEARAWQLEFKVMSYNTRAGLDAKGKTRFEDMAVMLATRMPDILAVQELGAKGIEQLGPMTALLNIHIFETYGKETWRPRVGLLSRWPFADTKDLKLKGGERTCGRAVLDVQGIPLVFYAPHFSRGGLVDSSGKGLVKELLGMGERSEQMEGLAKIIEADRHRFMILAGDLNTFPLSGPYRTLSGVMDDAFPALSTKGTYRLEELKQKLPEAVPSPRIDHIFHSKGLKVLRAEVVEEGYSDHYPVLAVMAINVRDFVGHGPELVSAQQRLAKLGMLKAAASGEMDPETRQALAAFQAKNGLIIDGILTQETYSRLMR